MSIGRVKAGIGLLLAAAVVGGWAHSARAQSKDLSDKSVVMLMQYAWALTPSKFTTPQGKVIEVDKTKRNEAVVPIEAAREIIRVARLSAYAQLCELAEEQRANYQTLMRREESKKWTDQQMLFINQLHLFTVMTLTGKVQLVDDKDGKDGDKRVVLAETKPVKSEPCSDAERQKVQAQIMAYVNMVPPEAPATAKAPGPAAAQRAEPVPASQKK